MTDIAGEVQAIPQELGNLVKGDVSLAGRKVPKLVFAIPVIGLVAFLAIRAGKSKGSSEPSAGSSGSGIGNSGVSSENSLPQEGMDLSGSGGFDSASGDGSSLFQDIGYNPLAALPYDDTYSLFGGTDFSNAYGVPDVSGLPSLQVPSYSSGEIPYFSGFSDVGNVPQPPLQNIVASGTGLVNANKSSSNQQQLSNLQQGSKPSAIQNLISQITKQSTPVQVQNAVNTQVNKISSENLNTLNNNIGNVLQNSSKPVNNLVSGLTGKVTGSMSGNSTSSGSSAAGSNLLSTIGNTFSNLIKVVTPQIKIPSPVVVLPKITPKVVTNTVKPVTAIGSKISGKIVATR